MNGMQLINNDFRIYKLSKKGIANSNRYLMIWHIKNYKLKLYYKILKSLNKQIHKERRDLFPHFLIVLQVPFHKYYKKRN